MKYLMIALLLTACSSTPPIYRFCKQIGTDSGGSPIYDSCKKLQ